MPDNAAESAWITARQGLLTASRVASLLSPKAFTTPLQVWQDMKGFAPPLDRATERFFSRRSGMERVIREDHEHEVGPITWEPYRIYQANDWGGATLDGLFSREGKRVVFEAKTTKDRPSWGDESDPSGVWSDHDVIEIPLHGGMSHMVHITIPVPYFFQVQWQMYHADTQHAVLVAAMGGRFDWIKSFEVPRDDVVIDYMLDVARDWYEKHIIGNTPPAPSTLAEAKWIYPQAVRKSITMPEEIEELWDNFLAARDASKTEDALKSRVAAFMGENDELLDRRGRVVATWKGGSSRRFLVK